jgi:hypothetical protein
MAATNAINTRLIAFMFSSPVRLGRYTSLSCLLLHSLQQLYLFSFVAQVVSTKQPPGSMAGGLSCQRELGV